MVRRFRYLCQAGRLSPDWRLPFTATFRRSGLAPAFAPSRSFCPSELADHNLLTAIRTTQFRARVAALENEALSPNFYHQPAPWRSAGPRQGGCPFGFGAASEEFQR